MMGLFSKLNRKSNERARKKANPNTGIDIPVIDSAILRQNNITLLTIDERWTSLFSGKTLPQVLLALQSGMNDTLKREATIRQEMDELEPSKKRAMQRIISLTKDAFEDGNEEAKAMLKQMRDDIEQINLKWSLIMEEKDGISAQLRDYNIKLLQETAIHVFSTMRDAKNRIPALDVEIQEAEAKLAALRHEREILALDWDKLSEPFSRLYGTEYVRILENAFAEEIKASKALLAAISGGDGATADTTAGEEKTEGNEGTASAAKE